jgi:hypothetical protein
VRVLTRRSALAVVAAVISSAVVAPAALAAGPDHAKTEDSNVVWPAGFVCSFPVQLEAIYGNANNTLTFPADENGDQLVRIVGGARLVITNLDTEESVELQSGGRIDLLFHPDGALDITISGRVVGAYFPTDVGGPALMLHHGLVQVEADAAFNFFSVSTTGPATDICALLASS